MNQTYVFTIQKNLACVTNWYWHINLVFSGERLSNFHVGVTDVVPRDQQHMTSSEFNLRRCGFYEGAVPNNATVRIECPPRVTGRYLVVQLQGSNVLSLCEVTAQAG